MSVFVSFNKTYPCLYLSPFMAESGLVCIVNNAAEHRQPASIYLNCIFTYCMYFSKIFCLYVSLFRNIFNFI